MVSDGDILWGLQTRMHKPEVLSGLRGFTLWSGKFSCFTSELENKHNAVQLLRGAKSLKKEKEEIT